MLLAAAPVTLVLTLSWFGVYTFINAYYTRGLGRSNAEWTALTLWFNGSMMFWPFVCVKLVSWIGHRRLTAASLWLCSILYLFTAFAHTTFTLSMIVTLMAIVPSALAVAWMPVIIAAGSDRPGRAIAYYVVISTTVGAIALIAGGRVLGLAGYQSLFVVSAAVAGVSALVFYALSARLPVPPPVRTGFLAIPRRDLWEFARGPVAYLLIAGVCMEPFNFHAANQLFPNLAHDIHGLRADRISNIVALGRLPALFSLVLLARIVDEVHVPLFYGIGLMLAGACVFATGSAGSTTLLIAAYCGYYLFHGAVWGTNTAAINRAVEPRQREYAMAITTSVSTGATFLVGVFHNRLLTAGLSLPTVIHLSGAIGAASGLIMICYSFTRFAAWSRRA